MIQSRQQIKTKRKIKLYYFETVPLKNGFPCQLRNAEGKDAEAFLAYFIQCHGETDFLTTYPDETEQDL